ncbi:hypothetical protein GBA52_012056 [Prunus armeniaca]|nr:hypothetical protein GBA52_012056 [Prunus armeniaca]
MLTLPSLLSKSHQLRDSPLLVLCHIPPNKASHAPSYVFSRPKTPNEGGSCQVSQPSINLVYSNLDYKRELPPPSQGISCYFFTSPRAVQRLSKAFYFLFY